MKSLMSFAYEYLVIGELFLLLRRNKKQKIVFPRSSETGCIRLNVQLVISNPATAGRIETRKFDQKIWLKYDRFVSELHWTKLHWKVKFGLSGEASWQSVSEKNVIQYAIAVVKSRMVGSLW